MFHDGHVAESTLSSNTVAGLAAMDVAVSTAHLPLEYVGVGIAFTIFEDVRGDFEDIDLYSCAVILFVPYDFNTGIRVSACIVTFHLKEAGGSSGHICNSVAGRFDVNTA